MENKIKLSESDQPKILSIEYNTLVDKISDLWEKAKKTAVLAVNSELLKANWQTGRYIVEFEQGGAAKAQYGKQLLINLSKDLTARRGKGFSRSNLTYMRKLYLTFPKCETLSHKLTWSHYFELLKCEDPMEMQFYFHEAIFYRKPQIQSRFGILPLHFKMLCPDRPQTFGNKTQRYRTNEHVSELF